MKNLQKGEYVNWKRHDGEELRGRVVDVFIEKFTRTIEGEEFHRTPDINSPAYLIEKDDGSEFILSHNELSESDNQEHPVVSDSTVQTQDRGSPNYKV